MTSSKEESWEFLSTGKQKQEPPSYLQRLVERLYPGSLHERFVRRPKYQRKALLYKKYLKLVNLMQGMLVLTNLFLAAQETENFITNNNISTDTTNDQRIAIMIISICLAIMVVVDYKLRLDIDKLELRTIQYDSLFTSRKTVYMFVEIMINLACCPPSFDFSFSGYQLKGSYTYSIDAIIFLFQLCKSYQFLRLWLEYSMWSSLQAQKIRSSHRIKSRLKFALKSELKYRPVLFITSLILITIFILGMAVRVFEKPFKELPPPEQGPQVTPNAVEVATTITSIKDFLEGSNQDEGTTYQKFDNISDSWWLMIITMTTTGFGDMYPNTHTGRCICILASVIGQLCVSLLVVSLANAAELSQEESKAFHTIKKIETSSKAKESACRVILLFLKYKEVIHNIDPKSQALKFLLNYQLKLQTQQFDREINSCRMDNLPMDEQLKQLSEKIQDKLQDIRQGVDRLHEFEGRLEKFLRYQKQSRMQLDEILFMQQRIYSKLIHQRYD